ncbi:MAG: DUF1059 domain-containing protein [Acidobacteriota bacterium]|jgi:predicted small metal-binding protein
MSKELHCADIMSDCNFVATAETEEELMTKVIDHAAKVHNIKTMTPELQEQVKGAIKTVAKAT